MAQSSALLPSGPVVSNTTPLISLAEIGLLAVAHTLYGELWIPEAVFSEYQTGISAHPQRPSLDGLSWITTHHVAPDPAVPVTLDPGEAEAIALARASGARLVLIDEQRGRAAAKRLGLNVAGSIAVLLEAKAQAIIPVIRPYLDQMIAQGRRIGPRLYGQAL
jgi:predicted nucleic acid-binding protein